MSDPMEYFEGKLKTMSLSELHAYKKLLDDSIMENISKNAPNEKIAPLIIYRGVLEYEIKSRTAKKE